MKQQGTDCLPSTAFSGELVHLLLTRSSLYIEPTQAAHPPESLCARDQHPAS